MGFFKRLFGGEPTSARDHYEQGLVCEKKTDHDRALVSFTEAIRLDPNFADAAYARAFVREITGDYENAINDFERTAELAPKVGDELVVETAHGQKTGTTAKDMKKLALSPAWARPLR